MLIYTPKMMKRLLFAPAFLLLAGCSEPSKPEQTATPAPVVNTVEPVVASVSPAGTTEKTVFNPQPDGIAAFSVNGKSFEPGAFISANGQKLDTAFGNPGWVTAKMSAEFYAKPGKVAITVTNPNGKISNSVDFKVAPKK